ncbi:hypothetical protein ODI_R1854 [Orrella dioscoreae]|uniref:Uncharacterized protein n=1 Tax=Orrella dioscoreae TaxID=1851544 RepID=A0A1C3K1P1_9BURK|nr:hypothetical protein ODI_03631 [Orrella dioscoreae]SOE49117.1 hypothetical protein ODI_R1854 [Orrella dioscoreae]
MSSLLHAREHPSGSCGFRVGRLGIAAFTARRYQGALAEVLADAVEEPQRFTVAQGLGNFLERLLVCTEGPHSTAGQLGICVVLATPLLLEARHVALALLLAGQVRGLLLLCLVLVPGRSQCLRLCDRDSRLMHPPGSDLGKRLVLAFRHR